MKILWLDPVNSDAQFLNLLSIILQEQGHQVVVCSNQRAAFAPPREVEWVPFSALGAFPTTLRQRPLWRLGIGMAYPFDWLRAALLARRLGVRAALVSTSLVLSRLDAWGLGWCRRLGIAPLVLVHRPYLNWHEEPGRASAHGPFYAMAKGFLVMSNFARDQLMSLYHIPEERIFHFPHPHFQPLLDRYVASPGLQSRLEEWAAGRPIIGFFANLTAEHGLDDLLEALPALRELLGDFRLLLISRLSAMDQSQALLVEERLAQLGLLEQCWRQWESYSYEDLKAYLEITTVAVAPYRWATQSGVVAMLAGAGIPVVATAVGGLPEMIRPGETGELVPPGNARALAQGLVRVISRAGEYRGRTRAHARAAFAPEKAAAVVVEALGAMGD